MVTYGCILTVYPKSILFLLGNTPGDKSLSLLWLYGDKNDVLEFVVFDH